MIELLDKVHANMPLKSLAAAVSADLSKTELQPDIQLRASEIRQEIASYIVGVVQTENDVLIIPPKHTAPFESHKYQRYSPDGTAPLAGRASTTAASHPTSNCEDEKFSDVHERSDDFYVGPVVGLSDAQGTATMSQLGHDIAPYRQDLGLEDILQFLRGTQSPASRRTSIDQSKA